MNVVIQLNSALSENAILGQIKNILKSTEPINVELVVHGEAGPLLHKTSKRASTLLELHKQGVVFLVCQNTLQSLNWTAEDMLSFVKVVPSAVVHLIQRQHNGWAYLKG